MSCMCASNELQHRRAELTLLLENGLAQSLDLSSLLCPPTHFLKKSLPRLAVLESHSFLRRLCAHATLLIHSNRLSSF